MDNAAPRSTAVAPAATTSGRNRPTGTQTKSFPESASLRSELTQAAERQSAGLRVGDAITKSQLERLARKALEECNQPDRFLGYMMVVLGNHSRRHDFLSVPFARRLLLVPVATEAGPSPLSVICQRAARLGYKVLTADKSEDVLRQILEGRVDALLGLATLDDLERAFDHSVLSGIPSYAVPLPAARELTPTDLEGDWVGDILCMHLAIDRDRADGYLSAMRAANRLFRDDFDRLLPRIHSKTPEAARTPLGLTEDVAYDWLANGGKRFRPFITLAAFDAAMRGQKRPSRPAVEDQPFSDSVCRVAMAIEAFHKASLVHDDIQDDDLFRYGRDTLHRSHGLGPAINIGDYLIGLGYRLVNSCRGDLGADVASDIIDSMSQAHLHLCDGQGAEMAWRDHPDWTLTVPAAVQMYALKTSPAFEAALFAGLRLAGPADEYRETVTSFCRELGVGFQIVNDLQDWVGDTNNKLVAGQDALALRPTVLLALALEAATDLQRQEIREILESPSDDAQRLARLKQLFTELDAFAAAQKLVTASRRRAQELADGIQPARLRSLFQFLLETVLPADAPPIEPRATARTSKPTRV